ncbi:DUF7379 domain-containing protein [Methylobacter tundripaludum]|uniref:DUF7379 domain-containing protein n=1 Tax=Methylobacter tundripaludum (strain ATCC BAA-1195 / DSM 17260 / SV96) TaxID=697282 RepID=G3IWS0_METTV|nr:hypothetical protein [Methylobacter tundripaludum]EGW23129.1 hypothetical protein Mettu_1969 [Methylobacter tundripaludum SV96]
MAFFNREGENPSFEFDGYQVRLASGTSFFRGDTIRTEEPPQEGIWLELGEENYRLIGNTLFTIDAAEKKHGLLSGIPPRLHIELTLQNPKQWYVKGYIVLILDNDRTSLVDWAVANPTLDTSSFFEPNLGNAAIYFDIPLVSSTREFTRTELLITTPDGRVNFLEQISQWEDGQQLTFGVFSFEDNKILHHLRRPYQLWPLLGLHPMLRDELFGLAEYFAKKADRRLKRNTGGNEQLQIILADGDTREATPQDLQQMQGNRALLLCHGILSSTKGAFTGILNDPVFMTHLHQRYAQNILAWDHYTLSKTTSQNATDLLANLNNLHDVELDIICHSRGAGVVRNFIENPSNRRQLAQQGIRINKIAFVAGACLGSQLAEAKNTNRLFRRLNMLFWCFGGAPAGFTSGILIVLKLLATVAQKMPGVEAMNPTGSEIATLNGYGQTAAIEYHYIRANYDIRFLPPKLIEEILWDAGVFDGAANDLVVPYEGASASSKYLHSYPGMRDHDALPFGSPTGSQGKVWHINFFDQDETKNELISFLP